MRSEGELEVDGRQLRVSNLQKVLYPATGFTKGAAIDYYARIAEVLLPHLRNRPVTLKRYPDGVDGESFYEKQAPSHRPGWLKTAPVWSATRAGNIDYCLFNDLPSLIWAANLAALELHAFLHRAAHIERPRALVFDLDPGAPATIVECCQVGLVLRRLFVAVGLDSFAKTSGSKGLQIYVPLNMATTYDKTKPFASAVADRLREAMPTRIVTRMQKSLRHGKIFIDWSQNDEHKTTVSVYSLRAKSRPTVSTPVKWSEVQRCARSAEPANLAFDTEQVLQRVKKFGDLFAPVLTLKQRLPALTKLAAVKKFV